MALVMLMWTLPTSAHNLGFTALAVPLDSITIDGDLSDWPKDLPAYQLGAVLKGYANYDSSDPSPEDLTSWFHVAWNPEQSRLYIAVIVIDSETILGSTPSSTDAIELYVDGRHGDDDPQQYLMFPGDATYRLFGTSTNPTLSGGDAVAAGALGEHRAVGDTSFYELSLQLGPEALRKGERISFDVVAVDMDSDAIAATWLSWSPQGGKVSNSSRTGDVWLLGSPGVLREMSRVRGRVAIPGGSGWRGMVVRLRDADGRSWAAAISDAEGYFEVIGRPGAFVLEVEDAEPPVRRELELIAGEPVEITLDVLGRSGHQLPMWPLAVCLGLLSLAALGALIPLRGRLDLLGGVLVAPIRTFERLGQRPEWTAPAAMVLLSATLASVASINQYPGQLWGALLGSPGGLAAVLLTSVPLLMLLALVVYQFGLWLAWSFALWVAAWLAGGRGRFFDVVSVAGYASVPAVLGLCVASLHTTFGAGGEVLTSSATGLGALTDDSTWKPLLGRVEVFSLWSWALGALSLPSVMALSKRRALLAGTICWFVVLGLVWVYHGAMQALSVAMMEQFS
jgi:hypothetical protein